MSPAPLFVEVDILKDSLDSNLEVLYQVSVNAIMFVRVARNMASNIIIKSVKVGEDILYLNDRRLDLILEFTVTSQQGFHMRIYNNDDRTENGVIGFLCSFIVADHIPKWYNPPNSRR